MRRRQQMRAQRQRGGAIGRDINIPLPVRGIMEEADTAEVSGMYAGELTNWESTGSSLKTRLQHSVSPHTGAQVWQRIPYEFRTAQQPIEATQTNLTAGGQTKLRSSLRPYSYGYISGTAILADGGGAPVLWNGSTFSDGVFTTSTGLDPAEFDGFLAHQDRPFFWKTGDELDFYYGDVGAITGALTRFPLGRLGNITGTILCLYSMTVDAGHGMNDTLAIFTTTGDVVVYEGLNPGDSLDWRQQSRLRMSPPVSREAIVKIGGDIWILTASGLVSVMATLQSGATALVNSISGPIQDTLIEAIEEGGLWSLHRSADARRVIINRTKNDTAEQWIFNTKSKSWETATYPARQWYNLGRNTHFTTLTGDLGTLDKNGTETITARWVSSWFRLPGANGINSIIPTIYANGALSVSLTVLSEHDETDADVTEATQTVTLEPDEPGARVTMNEAIAVDAVGEVFQLRMEVTATWAELVNIKASIA